MREKFITIDSKMIYEKVKKICASTILSKTECAKK